MRLEQLIEGLGIRVVQGDAARSVRDLTDDSRQVTAESLFIARTGVEADGRRFIADAIARGASAVLIAGRLPDAGLVPEHVTVLRAGEVDQPLAGRLAERFFGHPSRQLRLIGITGTNGKTTTAWIVRHLLHAAGVRCGLIGTVAVDEGRSADFGSQMSDSAKPGPLPSAKSEIPANTTPGAIEFSRLLARMVANGCYAAVAEVSSHALHQGRADALRFDAAVFTNLSGDHLDYHQTMDAYAAAKARLFRLLKPAGWAIVNADDAYADAMLAGGAAEGARVMRCRRVRADAAGETPVAGAGADSGQATATLLRATAVGSDARFAGPWGSVAVMLPLVGPHNVTNALQAVAAAQAVGGTGASLAEALAACPPVPGRLERVPSPAVPVAGAMADAAAAGEAAGDASTTAPLPAVLVDYAHTHDALENVLSALRPLTPGRLLVLFGCGGDRDATKRPKMARVAEQWADVIYVTSDNPRTEDPQRILADIMAGFAMSDRRGAMSMPAGHVSSPTSPLAHCPSHIHLEPDRAAAIRAAVLAAEPGDTVLLAGKGHEDYQIIGKVKRPFDDRAHAAAALAEWLTRPVAADTAATVGRTATPQS